jgi:hypothetical protein
MNELKTTYRHLIRSVSLLVAAILYGFGAGVEFQFHVASAFSYYFESHSINFSSILKRLRQ